MVKKLYLGQKLRRLREQKAVTQAALAGQLEISTSYLNQIEGNQRPVTLHILLRLCTLFNLDPASFAEDEEARLVADLREVMGDPLFGGPQPGTVELRNAAAASPDMVKRLLTLHQAYHKLRERADGGGDPSEPRTVQEVLSPGGNLPYEEVRDYFHYCNNYVEPLDLAAERLAATRSMAIGDMAGDLARHLSERHRIRIEIQESIGEQGAMRHYDAANRTLYISPQLQGPSRAFQLACQIALLDYGTIIDQLVGAGNFTTADARSICRVGLANYFAGALVMPYGPFLTTARAVRHDIEILSNRFGVSFEQACHRLSTLQRPGARGIPFYFVRVDMAGNITKRHSATRFQFARFGGACPLWNVHEAFAHPGKILVQLARMPDGIDYLSIARTVHKPGGGYLRPTRHFAVGLGCETAYASELVYSAGIDTRDASAAMNIGVNCRICERMDCHQRAFPPITGTLSVDESKRSFVPYEFTFPAPAGHG
jgi:predicted transcriptional regulator/transcriptional regulator with XRE-family HTH domain